MFKQEGRSPHRVERRPLVGQVVDGLGERLRSGEFALGEKLPSEPELSAQFGVGRSTVREAVRVLAHLGVLEVRQGDGTYVRDILGETEPLGVRLRRARLLEVYEVRRLLEVEAMVRNKRALPGQTSPTASVATHGPRCGPTEP